MSIITHGVADSGDSVADEFRVSEEDDEAGGLEGGVEDGSEDVVFGVVRGVEARGEAFGGGGLLACVGGLEVRGDDLTPQVVEEVGRRDRVVEAGAGGEEGREEGLDGGDCLGDDREAWWC